MQATPTPFWYARGGEVIVFNRGGPPVGIDNEVGYIEEEIPFQKGDKILLYTDGVVECNSKQGELFGTQRLKDIIKEHALQPIGTILDKINEAIFSFTGDHFPDDIALFGIEYKKK